MKLFSYCKSSSPPLPLPSQAVESVFVCWVSLTLPKYITFGTSFWSNSLEESYKYAL